MKTTRPNRNHYLHIRLNPSAIDHLKAQSAAAGLELSDLMRRALLCRAVPSAKETALKEVLADIDNQLLRMNGLVKHLWRIKTITPDQGKRLLSLIAPLRQPPVILPVKTESAGDKPRHDDEVRASPRPVIRTLRLSEAESIWLKSSADKRGVTVSDLALERLSAVHVDSAINAQAVQTLRLVYETLIAIGRDIKGTRINSAITDLGQLNTLFNELREEGKHDRKDTGKTQREAV